jgi:hypothetical protein
MSPDILEGDAPAGVDHFDEPEGPDGPPVDLRAELSTGWRPPPAVAPRPPRRIVAPRRRQVRR